MLPARSSWSRSPLLAALLLTLAGPVSAQVVELNPVPLSGTIRIGDWVITSLTVRADSSVGSSTVQVPVAPDTVEATYSTIVQVPAGGSAFYRITITAGLRSPDGTYGAGFQYQYPPTVAVEDGVPATLDMIADPPTLVRVTVTALPGELLEQVSASAEHTSGFPFAFFHASVSAPPGGVETLSFDLPVGSGVDLLCSGGALMTNGRGAQLEPFQVVTVPEGGVGACDFTPEEPPLTGGILGAIDYAGEVPVDQYRIGASRRGGGVEPDPITLLPPFVPGPGNYAGYEFTDVELASYDVNALVELEGGQQRLTFALAHNVGVTEDVTTVIAASEFCQATILSPFELGGISAPEDWNFGSEPVDPVSVVRIGEFGGSSQPQADPRDAPVRMLVRDGSWSQRMSFGIQRLTPLSYTNTSISRMIFQENIEVGCGETVTTPLRVLETGRIEVQFRVAGGGFLQNPIIQGSCSHPDASGEEIYRYDVTAYSANPGPSVQVGRVPVEAPAGICNFNATARVNGVNVSFGALNDIEIEPGVAVVIGLGGPRVQISSPAPDATVDAEEILVSGTATDDSQVVSVVVNGVAAALTPTGNPDDPQEVAFTATVPIESGDNRIAALATDDDGNETEASLHIENLMPPPPNDPPSVVITSPAPGSAVEGDVFVVEGLASDDVEVVSVRVSGFPAVLTPTGNPDDPNEVAFSATVQTAILPPGVLSTIAAVAQDDRGEQTTATIEVERVLPPLPCDANGDYVVDITDIQQIFAARGSSADGPDDPRDVNGDGLITINDGRLCVLQCTYPRCSPEDED